MGTNIVDADQGDPSPVRQRLAERDADEEGPDETGTRGHGDRVERLERSGGLLEGAAHDDRDALGMGSARDLGHDALIGGVEVVLAVDRAREHAPRSVGHPRRGVVTGGVDAEDPHVGAG